MVKSKDELILEQTRIILDLMDQNLPTSEFKERLDSIPRLKLQALKNALETTKQSKEYTSQNLSYLNSKKLEKDVGVIKKEGSDYSPFYSSGSKDYGVSPGNKAKKTIKQGEQETEKHKNIWFAKQGATADTAMGDDYDSSSDGSTEEYYSDDESYNSQNQHQSANFVQSNLFSRNRSYSSSSEDSSDDDFSDDESDISSNEDLISFDRTTLPSEFSPRNTPNFTEEDDRKEEDKNSEYYDGKGEDVSEIIATNLSHLYLDSENESPKIRLLVERDKTSIVSKGIKDYKDYYQYKTELERDRRLRREVEEPYISGFGKCFATSYLLADPDMNGTNIGVVTTDKAKIFARIDFGKSLSYDSISSPEIFANDLLNRPPKVYDKKQFQGLEFAGEIESTIAKFDQSNTEEVISFTMKNLREAYGEDFLSNPEISEPLKRRMRFSPEEELTEESIKERICQNMQNSCVNLRNMAESKMQEIFPSHPRDALDAYKLSMVNGKIDYSKFIKQLEKKGVDFKNPNHFNALKAKETSNPMLTALIEAKEVVSMLPPISHEAISTTNVKKPNTIKGR